MSTQPQPAQSADKQGEVIPPNAVPPMAPGTAYANFTQIQSYVPPAVWTTEALFDYHAKQKEVILDNNRIFEGTQKRLNSQQWGGLIIAASIIGVGLYLTIIGNPFGEKLVGLTVAFMAGLLAGKGVK